MRAVCAGTCDARCDPDAMTMRFHARGRGREKMFNSPPIPTSSSSTRDAATVDGSKIDEIRHNLAVAEHDLEAVPYTPPEVVIRWVKPLAAMARALLDELDRLVAAASSSPVQSPGGGRPVDLTGELRAENEQLRERIGLAHQVVQEAQRLAFEVLESSGATRVEHEERTAEQVRLVSMYSLVHDGVKRLAGRPDIELPALATAQVLVIEYKTALAVARSQLADARARLEAVKAAARDWKACGEHTGIASNRCMLPPRHAGSHDCQVIPGDADYFAALSVAPQPEPAAPEDALGLNEDAKQIIDELRDLWQRALEREGNLASAVADVVWKATQYGTTEDGDTYAYLVPKGTMHRLVGVAQSNGAHVPVSFRAASPPVEPGKCEHGKVIPHIVTSPTGGALPPYDRCPGPVSGAAPEATRDV